VSGDDEIASGRRANSREFGRTDATDISDRAHYPNVRTLAIATTALLLVVATGAGGALVAATPPTDRASPATPSTAGEAVAVDDDNESTATPGERVYGVVGVQDDRIRSTVNVSAYDARLAASDSPRERAAVVAEQLNATDRRLTALERQRDRLVQARDAGELSSGEFRARSARLAERTRAVDRLLDRSGTAVSGLPDGVREDRALDDRIAEQRGRTEAILAGPVGSAAAAFDDVETERAAPVGFDRIEATFTAGGPAVPGPLTPLFGDERITVHVRQANGNVGLYHVRTADGDVVEAGPGPAEDPTLHVFTTHEVVREIADAENPWRATDRALSEDRITVRGTGVLGTVKYWTASVLYDLYDGARSVLAGVTDFLGG